MGVEGERLLGNDPESTGSSGAEGDATPVRSSQLRRRAPRCLTFKTGSLALVLFIVALGFLLSSARLLRDDQRNPVEPEQLKPEKPSGPTTVASGEDTAPDRPEPDAGRPEPLASTLCPSAQFRFPDQTMALAFQKGRNLTFQQDQHVHEGSRHVKVGGQVQMRRLEAAREPRVVLEVVTNDQDLRLDVLLDEPNQAIKVSAPKMHNAGADAGPCIEMRATVFVPEDAELDVLTVAVGQLDVRLQADLSIHVANYAQLASIDGDVISASDQPRPDQKPARRRHAPSPSAFVPAGDDFTFNARVMEVTSASGRICGTFPLYDMLGLHTTSGDIDVSISPEAESQPKPEVPVLSITSISGHIYATEPVYTPGQIPLRDYLVDVHSTSGDVRGAFVFGSGAQIKSTAGGVAVDLLPIMDQAKLNSSYPAQLETETTSGSNVVNVLTPQFFLSSVPDRKSRTASHGRAGRGRPRDGLLPAIPGQQKRHSVEGDTETQAHWKALDCLSAVHKSTSAQIGLQYPQAFVGHIDAETTGGELKVRGRDVKIMKTEESWPGARMTARKGANLPASTIQIVTLMGGVDALIGEDE